MATTTNLTGGAAAVQALKLAQAQATYDAKHPPATQSTAAPLTDLELGKIAAQSQTPAVSAATPTAVPITPISPAPSTVVPASVAPAPQAASTSPLAPAPAVAPVTSAQPTSLTTAVTDPLRTQAATVAATPAASPSTATPSTTDPIQAALAAAAGLPASKPLSDAGQQAVALQRSITPDMPIEQQRAIKAQVNALYQTLPQDERLQYLHEVQNPSTANKLAGVRGSQTVAVKSGTSDLSDEQLGKLALAQQVKDALGPNATAAQTQAAFTAALQTQGALQTPAVQAAVEAATANLQARSDQLNELLPGANIDLAGDRERQQAATVAATTQAINDRLEANVAGTNIGNGQFIGGTPGTVVRSDSGSTRPETVPAAPSPSGSPVAVGLPLQHSPFLEFDQRPLAELAGTRGAVLPAQPSPLSSTALSATEARALDPGAALAADPVRTQALIDRLQQEADSGLRNPNNAAAQIASLKAKLAIGAPTGRTNAEIFADPTLTREQRLAEMSLNSNAKKTPAAALGISPSQVIAAKSGTSTLSDSQLIALARAMTPAGQPLPITVQQADAFMRSLR